jgi:hypothetical protein
LIEEDVADRVARSLRLTAWILDRIDPVRRLSHVVPVVALLSAAYMGWRTRSEHAASPNSMQVPMNVGDRVLVGLAPRCAPKGIPYLRGAGADRGSRGTPQACIQGVSVVVGEIDRYRKRWRRVRRRLRLVDPLAEDFGTGGVARHAPDVHVRFVILASEPEVGAVDCDEPFWEWWMQDRPNPFEGAARNPLGAGGSSGSHRRHQVRAVE